MDARKLKYPADDDDSDLPALQVVELRRGDWYAGCYVADVAGGTAVLLWDGTFERSRECIRKRGEELRAKRIADYESKQAAKGKPLRKHLTNGP